MAYTAKPPARLKVCLEYRLHGRSQGKVCKTHNACCHFCHPGPGVNRSCNPLDEFGFTYWPQFERSFAAVELLALHEHRLVHPVTAPEVRGKLIDQIAASRVIPDMVMGIADQELRLDGLLGGQGQPFFPVSHC